MFILNFNNCFHFALFVRLLECYICTLTFYIVLTICFKSNGFLPRPFTDFCYEMNVYRQACKLFLHVLHTFQML
ncbi:hypothetical protein BMB171_C4960 [Bacillus thuringiensis BMB171]|nr:hypothetical protein BMB171_C4960 [Bacillus thuringiensis BMB171]